MVQNWLQKLSWKYKNIYKNVLITRYKHSNMIKNYNKFLIKIENLKSYIVKFEENSVIKPKIYLFNYVVKDEDC